MSEQDSASAATLPTSLSTSPDSLPSHISSNLPIEPPIPITAARAVYGIAELRSHIYRFLGKADLARFMRVEKACADEVPKELYREMDWRHLQSMMISAGPHSSDRHTFLFASVAVINISLTAIEEFPFSQEIFGGRTSDAILHARAVYSRGFHEYIVPTLRTRCPNTQRIIFNSDIWGFRELFFIWEVGFTASHLSDVEDTGYIESTIKIHTIGDRERSPVPTVPGFDVRVRYDVDVIDQCSVPARAYGLPSWWRSVLFGGARLGTPYRKARFGLVSITIGDIMQLFQYQLDAGYAELLQDIVALDVVPWTVQEFRTFASIASVSLKHLCLRSRRAADPPFVRQGVAIRDVPELFMLIRDHLPNLEFFATAIVGKSRDVEAECERALSVGCLQASGSIKQLLLYMEEEYWHPHLPNTLRLIYCVCAWQAQISMDAGSEIPRGDWKDTHHDSEESISHPLYCDQSHEEQANCDQTMMLHSLQKLSRKPRAQIETLDLRTLGVTTPQHLLELTFTADDHPIPIWQSRIARWEGQISKAATTVAAELDECAAQAKKIRHMSSARGNGEGDLKEARGLLAKVQLIKGLLKDISEGGLEDQMKEYVKVLEGGTG